jgi:hypothetical protein
LKFPLLKLPIGSLSEAWQRARDEVRRSGRNSDEWLFGDGIDGVDRGYSSLVPDPLRLKNMIICNALYEMLRQFELTQPHSKFAPAQLLCVAQ